MLNFDPDRPSRTLQEVSNTLDLITKASLVHFSRMCVKKKKKNGKKRKFERVVQDQVVSLKTKIMKEMGDLWLPKFLVGSR